MFAKILAKPQKRMRCANLTALLFGNVEMGTDVGRIIFSK